MNFHALTPSHSSSHSLGKVAYPFQISICSSIIREKHVYFSDFVCIIKIMHVKMMPHYSNKKNYFLLTSCWAR